MAKRKIKLSHIANLKKVGRTTDNITISEFFDLHEKFMEEKELENLFFSHRKNVSKSWGYKNNIHVFEKFYTFIISKTNICPVLPRISMCD